MAAAGAIAFKLFTTEAVKGREDEFTGLSVTNIDEIYQALELVRDTGLRCAFHAEDQRLIDMFTARARGLEGPDHFRHLRSRPSVVETTAAAQLIAVAETPLTKLDSDIGWHGSDSGRNRRTAHMASGGEA